MVCYVCFNRGLFHFDDLLRTSPDNHVELSSVCVRPPGATSSRIRFPQPFAVSIDPILLTIPSRFPTGLHLPHFSWTRLSLMILRKLTSEMHISIPLATISFCITWTTTFCTTIAWSFSTTLMSWACRPSRSINITRWYSFGHQQQPTYIDIEGGPAHWQSHGPLRRLPPILTKQDEATDFSSKPTISRKWNIPHLSYLNWLDEPVLADPVWTAWKRCVKFLLFSFPSVRSYIQTLQLRL